MKGRIRWLMVLFSILATVPPSTQGAYRILEKTPLSNFTEEDIALSDKAHEEALEERDDGEPASWANPDTGASGMVTPLKTEQIEGRNCRLLRIVDHAGGWSGDYQFWFCKQPDGQWKITTPEKQLGP